MSKKIISVILILSLILSFFTVASAEGNPELRAYEGNTYTAGVSQIFFFEDISPDMVYVNDEVISDYSISTNQGKLYVYGRVFSSAGTYTVKVTEGDIEAETEVTISDNTQIYEYSVNDEYEMGALVNPSSTAGAEHSALGSSGGRKPIIVRNITSSQLPDLWVKWNITNSGKFSIDYWSPKAYVSCPVTVTVADKNGVHIFENLCAEEQTAKYITLSENDTDAYIFDFTGDGEYYLKVQAYAAQKNFMADSFKMYESTEEHNTETPVMTSDVYSIEGNSINGVLFHTPGEEIAKNIAIPADCVYELNTTGEFADAGDSLIIKKIFDESIYTVYTFGSIQYISSLKYEIDGINSEISQIPFGETYDDFLSNIVHNELVAIKVFEEDTEKTDGVIADGDILKIYIDGEIASTFTLSVIPASGENTIYSDVYEITDDKVYIPYGESISDIVSNITVSEYAVLSHQYEDELSKKITKSFKLTVTAQNGNVREYTADIVIGNSDTSELSSTVYTVDSNIISQVQKATSTDEFLAGVFASNGGSIKIYDKNMTEKVSGNIENGDTVRVFPRYRYSGNEYSTYVIQMAPDYRINAESEIVWSCADDVKNTADNLSFTCTNFRDGSGFSRIRKGYNDVSADAGENIRFNYTAEENGVVNVDYFATTDTEGVSWSYTVTVLKNNEVIAEKNISISESQLVDLGDYKLSEGDVLAVSPKCTSGTNTFVSATLFTRLAVYDAYIGNIETDTDNFCSFDIGFSFEPDESTITDGLRIVSENGNLMPYTFTANPDGYHITTEYPVEAGVRYFIQADKISATNGEQMSYTVVVPVPLVSDDVRLTVRLDSGDRGTDAEISVKSDISEDITVYCIQYKNNNVVKIDSYPYSIVSGVDFSSTENIEAVSGSDRLAIFAVGFDGRLLTNTYYAD